MVQIVWFKRDLRVHDHRPLADAAASGERLICLYVLEPELWSLPEHSGRQYAFLRECLESLDASLRRRGAALTVRVGDPVAILDGLHRVEPVSVIRAHEETGLRWTWERDKRVAAWARRVGAAFVETPQTGVIRGLRTRNGWAKRWEAVMAEPVWPAPQRLDAPTLWSEPPPSPERLEIADDPCPLRQPGGRPAAIADLRSFLENRGRTYRRAMSSPVTAFDACSRLSAHLAFGVLSMRETTQAAARALAARRLEGEGAFAASIESFLSRLHWHCHFMQKFEDEPAIEERDLHPAYRGRRPEAEADVLRRWIEGETGYPFLDACMRALKTTGWLNFRMRAMAAAFSSYHLWQDWRRPAQALAARFVDFEPGIHYPQFQMQSGTTGVNTPRIYNPVKQSLEQDPDGVFIARWVPELATLPPALRHEPWRATQEGLAAAGVRLGETYPERLVDHEQAARMARERIGAIRAGEDHAPAARAIQSRHGSRKSGLKATGSASSRRRRAAAPDDRQTRFEF